MSIFAGLTSIFVFGAALVTAVIAMLKFDNIAGLAYAVFILIASLPVLYFFCRKCPHAASHTCRHVFPGMLTKKFFRLIKPSRYSLFELAMAFVPIALIVAIPQIFLYRTFRLFVLFWTLIAAALFLVFIKVCPECSNTNCLFCPRRNKSS